MRYDEDVPHEPNKLGQHVHQHALEVQTESTSTQVVSAHVDSEVPWTCLGVNADRTCTNKLMKMLTQIISTLGR